MESVEVKKSFWKNKKVLITGHNGFKGSWLTAILSVLGSKIYGLSLKPSVGPTIFRLAKIDELTYLSKEIDIRNFKELSTFIKETNPEIIFHLAAQSLVGVSYENPVKTYDTNIMGTINLFEAIKEVESVKVVVNVTSDKCYENKESQINFSENDKMGGNDPYSSSKGCVELISEAYRRSFFNKRNICLPSVRAGNVIGGGDYSDLRLIPDIFRSIDKNEQLIVRSINAIRPWQHVLDPLYGYIKVAELGQESLNFSLGWNFGPKKCDVIKVGDILNIFKSHFSNLKWTLSKDQLFEENKYLHLDISNSQKKLNWKPKISIHKALSLTIDWFNETKKVKNMQDFTINQIKNYQKLLYLDEANKNH